jgi:hypothetical protein
MKLEEQIELLYNLVGYTRYTLEVKDVLNGEKIIEEEGWRNSHGVFIRAQSLPKFSLDLIHEAEGKLDDKQQNFYAWMLCMSVDKFTTWKPEEYNSVQVWELGLTECWFIAHATKEQRLEALLKTLGKWKE